MGPCVRQKTLGRDHSQPAFSSLVVMNSTSYYSSNEIVRQVKPECRSKELAHPATPAMQTPLLQTHVYHQTYANTAGHTLQHSRVPPADVYDISLGLPPTLWPDPPPYTLKLSDVELFYVNATKRAVDITKRILASKQGCLAAFKAVPRLQMETPEDYAIRVINTANPDKIYEAFISFGFTDPYARAVMACRWASIALQHARRCYENPQYKIDRVGSLGYNMLTLAVRYQSEIAVYWLVRRGASPYAKNADGSTALSFCAHLCESKCVFAIQECVHERMKLLLLSEPGIPPAHDVFVEMIHAAMNMRVPPRTDLPKLNRQDAAQAHTEPEPKVKDKRSGRKKK